MNWAWSLPTSSLTVSWLGSGGRDCKDKNYCCIEWREDGTGKSGMLQFLGLQRVGYDFETEQ